MTLQGKGYFIWKVNRVEGGDVNLIARMARQAGLTHILVKIAEGIGHYNIVNGVDLVPPLAQALRGQGLQVWGWHYVYGYDPIAEADRAVQRMRSLGLDGYVIDAEAEYKYAGRSTAARAFMQRLRAGLPNTPVALSSYRYPSYHPQLPWREFLSACDLNMPQVYWIKAHNPAEQLLRCLREFQAIVPFRPIIPTGAAFTEHGWSPSEAEVLEFLRAAKNLDMPAANFWEWNNTRTFLPRLWTTIADFNWPGGQAEVDIAQRYLATLNTRDPGQMLALYHPAAVHVTAQRTARGEAALRDWYTTLFSRILPNATFNLADYSGDGGARYLRWTASSAAGQVTDGSDTLGVMDGKIIYHYTAFSLR